MTNGQYLALELVCDLALVGGGIGIGRCWKSLEILKKLEEEQDKNNSIIKSIRESQPNPEDMTEEGLAKDKANRQRLTDQYIGRNREIDRIADMI